MRRLLLFARSIIPEDPTQLLFLVGSFLLLICMELRCFPLTTESVSGQFSIESFDGAYQLAFHSWNVFSFYTRLIIFFAGAAGLLIGILPGPRPLLRSLIFVCLPALAGLTLLCVHFLPFAARWNPSHFSVLHYRPYSEAWILKNVWSLGPGLRMAALGIVLVLVFLSRQAMGISSLPLRLPQSQKSAQFPDGEWAKTETAVWALIPGIFLAWVVASILYSVTLALWPRGPNFYFLVPMFNAFAIGLLAGSVVWAIGESWWKEFRSFIRLPDAKLALLGVAIPVAINLVPNFLTYFWDRIQWGMHGLGKYSPPRFASYFQVPDPIYLWFILAAGMEEVIWRGYLQPRFIRRYGLIRGILLIGLSWGAIHFLRDFQGTARDYDISIRLGLRLGLCITMSFVLGWLTLRSNSIWPAVLAHGLHNVWVLSRPRFYLEIAGGASSAIVLVCFGFLGYLLFKYWPPPAMAEEGTDIAESSTEVPA